MILIGAVSILLLCRVFPNLNLSEAWKQKEQARTCEAGEVTVLPSAAGLEDGFTVVPLVG